MIRSLFALAALTVGLSAASADELKGTIKSVNTDANKLTLTINGKDRTLPVSKDASFVSVTAGKAKKGKPKETMTPLDGGLGALKAGSAVTVLTEKAGEKDQITSVKVGTGDHQPAKKKKAKKPKKPAALLQPISTNAAVVEEVSASKKAAKTGDKAKGKKAKKAAKKKGKHANKKKGKKGDKRKPNKPQ